MGWYLLLAGPALLYGAAYCAYATKKGGHAAALSVLVLMMLNVLVLVLLFRFRTHS